MMVGDDLTLNHGDHRIATTKAEEADEKESVKELKVYHTKVIASPLIPPSKRGK